MTEVGCFYCEYLPPPPLVRSCCIKRSKTSSSVFLHFACGCCHWLSVVCLWVGGGVSSAVVGWQGGAHAAVLWLSCDQHCFKKKKSIENPGFRELVQAWLLILASSCTLDMTLALQYSFKSWKTQCSPRHGYGFQRGSLQLCKRMAGLTAQPHPFTYQAFFSGPVLPWVAHSINHGCSCPVYPLGPLLHLCRL